MDTLRYILIGPAALIAWLCALFFTLRIEYYRVVYFCPNGMSEGSDCYARDWVMWPLWLVTFGAALSSTLIIAVVAFIAPRNKLKIAGYTLCIGLVLAMLLAVLSGYFVPYLASTFSGVLSVLLVARLTNASIATTFPLLRLSKAVNPHHFNGY